MHYESVSICDQKDVDLVRLVQARDEAAFKELMSRYNPLSWSIINENARQHRDAEEILMDIWMVVWENIIGLRKAESFSGWLRRVAFTACKRYYARGKSHQNELLLNYEDLALQIDREAEKRFNDDRILEDAREAVQHLPQSIRDVGIKYYLEQWTITDIADELNLPTGTVKTKLSKVRNLLRKEFEVKTKPMRRKTVSTGNIITEKTQSRVRIIGVGGAGCNVVRTMAETESADITFYAIDTDKETLKTCTGAMQMQIGANTTHGDGTHGNLALGRQAAAEGMDQLRSIVEDAQVVIVTAGLGGGTGTSVAPVLASLAREQDALTICVVTRPFHAEGKKRDDSAEIGLQELHNTASQRADAVMTIPNEQVLEIINNHVSLQDVLKESNEILINGISAFTDIVRCTGEISVTVDDIKQFVSEQANIQMSIGKASGENRAKIAAQNAMSSPLLSGNRIADAMRVLIGIEAPSSFDQHELADAMITLTDKSEMESCIFGMTHKDELEQSGEVVITVIACMPDDKKKQDSKPSESIQDDATGEKIGTSLSSSEYANQVNYSEYDLSQHLSNDASIVRSTIENSVSTTVKNQANTDIRVSPV